MVATNEQKNTQMSTFMIEQIIKFIENIQFFIAELKSVLYKSCAYIIAYFFPLAYSKLLTNMQKSSGLIFSKKYFYHILGGYALTKEKPSYVYIIFHEVFRPAIMILVLQALFLSRLLQLSRKSVQVFSQSLDNGTKNIYIDMALSRLSCDPETIVFKTQ